jgi:ferritin-like protein
MYIWLVKGQTKRGFDVCASDMVVQADPCVLRGIPEFFETTIGESLKARTESLSSKILTQLHLES